MVLEAALLPRNISSFVIPFYYGSGTGTVINYGSGSASPKAKSFGSYDSGSGSTTLKMGKLP